MGRGIKLTEAEWDALDRRRFSTPSADVFRNCLIVLMSDSRETIAGIAATVGCSAETVKRIRKLYRQGGLQALQPIKPPGRPSQVTPAFLTAMKQVAQGGDSTKSWSPGATRDAEQRWRQGVSGDG